MEVCSLLLMFDVCVVFVRLRSVALRVSNRFLIFSCSFVMELYGEESCRDSSIIVLLWAAMLFLLMVVCGLLLTCFFGEMTSSGRASVMRWVSFAFVDVGSTDLPGSDIAVGRSLFLWKRGVLLVAD